MWLLRCWVVARALWTVWPALWFVVYYIIWWILSLPSINQQSELSQSDTSICRRPGGSIQTSLSQSQSSVMACLICFRVNLVVCRGRFRQDYSAEHVHDMMALWILTENRIWCRKQQYTAIKEGVLWLQYDEEQLI